MNLPPEESRIIFFVPTELKEKLEASLTPPGMAKPPYGAVKSFFLQKIKTHLELKETERKLREAGKLL